MECLSSGAPFDVILVAGRTTEDGMSLSLPDKPDTLYAFLARMLHSYISSELSLEAAAQLNNSSRMFVSSVDDDIRMLACPGYARAELNAPAVVRDYAAPHLLAATLHRWATSPASDGSSQSDFEVASLSHLSDDYALLMYLQTAEDGHPLLETYDKELAQLWKVRRPPTSQLSSELILADEAYVERRLDAVALAERRAEHLSTSYLSQVEAKARELLNSNGPLTARSFLGASSNRLTDISGTLVQQRSILAETLAAADARAKDALEDLQANLARRSLFQSSRALIEEAIVAITEAHRARYGFDLTEIAILTLSRLSGRIAHLTEQVESLALAFTSLARSFKQREDGYESRDYNVVESLTARPLHTLADIQLLFAEVTGCEWAAVETAGEIDLALRGEVGELGRWLGAHQAEVEAELLQAATRVLKDLEGMSLDQFLRWKSQLLGLPPAKMLRELLNLAPLLGSFNEALIPESDGLYQDEFTLVGVADKENSIFTDVGPGLLVSTSDTTAVTVLRLRVGLPASALQQYGRMLRAHEFVSARGVVTYDIYDVIYNPPSRQLLTEPSRPMPTRGRPRKNTSHED